MVLRPLCALLLLLPAAPAGAQVLPLPGAVAIQPVEVPSGFTPRDRGPDHAPSCLRIYSNETTATGFYAAAGAGIEIADDLHTTSEGTQALCAFDFGYYKPGPGVVDATVTFYANAGDGPPGAVLAGPYFVTGLPTGANAFHVEVAAGLVTPDVWMAVAFSDGETGLLTFGPPDQGASHDVAWLSPPGQLGNFDGGPPADFFLGVYSSPAAPAAAATWGRLKAVYR